MWELKDNLLKEKEDISFIIEKIKTIIAENLVPELMERRINKLKTDTHKVECSNDKIIIKRPNGQICFPVPKIIFNWRTETQKLDMDEFLSDIVRSYSVGFTPNTPPLKKPVLKNNYDFNYDFKVGKKHKSKKVILSQLNKHLRNEKGNLKCLENMPVSGIQAEKRRIKNIDRINNRIKQIKDYLILAKKLNPDRNKKLKIKTNKDSKLLRKVA